MTPDPANEVPGKGSGAFGQRFSKRPMSGAVPRYELDTPLITEPALIAGEAVWRW